MTTELQGRNNNQLNADEFRGRKVIDREGIEYGKVKHVQIDCDTLQVTGITVHEGFHKDYFLPRGHIDRFTNESVLLGTAPLRKDTSVVDIDGHKIGKIKKINKNQDTNEIESIEVSEGLTGTRVFSKSEIWGIGEKVILKLAKDEYKKSH
ncbi:MAG TPA: PRC-barrel domain-containing protein [Nitrosopumilaceae archaeon]|nr:PRC-barrel domain-containing protein [Nitrosopumilaceae archaeon]